MSTDIRPLCEYTMPELRRLALHITRLAPDMTVAGRAVHLLQVRYQPTYFQSRNVLDGHSFYEGILMLLGSVHYHEANDKCLLLQPGDVLLYPPGYRHAWHAEGEGAGLRLVCWFEIAGPPLARLAYPVNCPQLLCDATLLTDEAATRPTGWHTRVPLRLTTILTTMVTLADPTSVALLVDNDGGILDIIKRFILDNIAESFTLNDIATQCDMSARSLERVYRRMKGRTLWKDLQDMRLEQAAMMLADTDRPINEIATAVGLHDPAYFCARFRRRYEMSPGEYRMNAKSAR